jgi:hypothetical protein
VGGPPVQLRPTPDAAGGRNGGLRRLGDAHGVPRRASLHWAPFRNKAIHVLVDSKLPYPVPYLIRPLLPNSRLAIRNRLADRRQIAAISGEMRKIYPLRSRTGNSRHQGSDTQFATVSADLSPRSGQKLRETCVTEIESRFSGRVGSAAAVSRSTGAVCGSVAVVLPSATVVPRSVAADPWSATATSWSAAAVPWSATVKP